MFKPLRFQSVLKALPGMAHLQLTPQAAHHARSKNYVHVQEQIEIDRTRASKSGAKETHIREDIKEDVRVESKKGRKTTEVYEHVTRDIDVRKTERDGETTTTTLQHVHATKVGVTEVEMTPPHLPREETPIYARTHHHLVYTQDTPCAICGVRHSTLSDPKENPFGATAIETHHYPIERSLLNACDPRKVHVIFPQVKDYDSLEAFIDSEENMMVLCDVHHRHPYHGIHHILAQDFFIQPFLFGGYQIVAKEEDAQQIMQANEKIIKNHQPKK